MRQIYYSLKQFSREVGDNLVAFGVGAYLVFASIYTGYSGYQYISGKLADVGVLVQWANAQEAAKKAAQQ